MQVVDHVVNDHQFFIQLQIGQLRVNSLRAEIFCEYFTVAHPMNLLKQLGAILRKFLNVLARLEMLHRLLFILLLHIEHIAVEGRLDEGTDGFRVE